MTQHSSADIETSDSPVAEIPLLDRPLVADEQNTVVSRTVGDAAAPPGEVLLNATAQEIRDRLFASPDSGHASEHGLRIGHFEVDARIGAGGMGAVFRATDLDLSRHVALKVLHPGIAADPALVARFRNEARAAARLNHDNIARVYFTGNQDGVHYIAYELADGKTIKQLIAERGRLSVEETVNYAIQATLALNHINAAGIIHRDIKPSNIILTPAARIKVVDLGLARRDSEDSVADLTVAGTTLGTFDYISPEQARDPSTADIRSDIYSLGCTVYHMLTGSPPYPDGTALQKLLDHQGKSPPDPRARSSDVPPEVSFIVMKMMDTNSDARYQDPGQLLADLISVAGRIGLRSVPAEGIVWRRIPVHRVRELSGSLFLTGAVMAICLTALVMHFVPQPSQAPEHDIQAAVTQLRPEGVRLDLAQNSGVVPVAPEASDSASEQAVDEASAAESSRETGAAATEPSPTEQAGGVPVPVVAEPFRLQSVSGSITPCRTLAESLEKAASGDVILLDFDGALAQPSGSMPRSRRSRSLEIRAVGGRKPILEFMGDSQSSSPGQFFRLNNDQSLTIVGVHIRLVVQDQIETDQWSVFECVGANRVSLRNCTIEVVNPARGSAAVMRLVDVVETTEQSPADFELSEVAVRGICDVAVAEGQTPLNILFEESAFLIDGVLLNNRGSDDMTRTTGAIDVVMKHNTCVHSSAAFLMEDSDLLTIDSPQRILPQVSVTAYSNVFASAAPGGILVQSQGADYVSELMGLLSWNGDFNLYHQIETFWDIHSATNDSDSLLLEFDDWIELWTEGLETQDENAGRFTAELWQNPGTVAALSPADVLRQQVRSFELDRSIFFAEDAASDFQLNAERRMPGAKLSELPAFPPVDSFPPESRQQPVVTPSAEADP